MHVATEETQPQELAVRIIPVDKIFISEGRKLRIDAKDEDNVRFCEDMHRVGLLHPIKVRPPDSDGKYELVLGRRRLWAAKQLKWQEITAEVVAYQDDELRYLQIVENVDRKQLTPVQKLEAIKHLAAEHEKIFGPNPGRKISGRANAASAVRDPVTKQFARKPLPPPATDAPGFDPRDPHGDFRPTPSSAIVAPDGTPVISAEQTDVAAEPAKSYVETAAGPMAKSRRQTFREAKAANAFTAEQLTMLDACDQMTMKGLSKLAKIKDVDRRAVAVSAVCIGESVDEAIEAATADTAEMAEILNARAQEQLSDDKWVDLTCAKPLTRIQDTAAFREAAILYRHTLEARSVFRGKVRKIIEESHAHRKTPLSWQLRAMIYINHPESWFICGNCLGLNRDEPGCPECKGTGFQTTFDWPKRKQ